MGLFAPHPVSALLPPSPLAPSMPFCLGDTGSRAVDAAGIHEVTKSTLTYDPPLGAEGSTPVPPPPLPIGLSPVQHCCPHHPDYPHYPGSPFNHAVYTMVCHTKTELLDLLLLGPTTNIPSLRGGPHTHLQHRCQCARRCPFLFPC